MTIGNWVRSWKRSQTPKTIRRPRLGMEHLEDRTTPAISATVNAGVLTVSLSGNDNVTVGGLSAAGTDIDVVGNAFPQQNFSGITGIVVNDTSGGSATGQRVGFDTVGGTSRITLTGSLTVTNIETIALNSLSLPLTASGITFSGASVVNTINTLPQLSTSGTISITASGTGDAIGTAANPIRLAVNGAHLTTNTTGGNGNQYFDLGGGFVNVNVGLVGAINAGTGQVTLNNGQFFGVGNASDYGDSTTFNVGAAGVLTLGGTETIGGLTGSGIVGGGGQGNTTAIIGGGNVSSSFSGTIVNVTPGNTQGAILSLTKTGTGTFTLTGSAANSYTGTTTIANGTLTLATSTNDAALSNTIIVGDGSGAAGSAVLNLPNSFEIPDAATMTIRADGVVNKTGANAEDLTTLNVNGGALNIATGATFAMRTNGTITSDGANGSSISGSGFLQLQSGTQTFNIANGPGLPDLVVSAPINQTGNPNITKTGAGTLVLSGAVGLGGTITVGDGTLLINGTIENGVAATDVTTSGDGVIGGTGTIQGSTVITSGGSLLPGDANTVGTLNTGNVTLNSGSFLGVKLTGFVVGDSLNVTGTVNLGGATLFAIDSLAALGQFVIINNDGTDPITGTFAGLPEGATFVGDNGKPFLITYRGGTGNDVVLTPETLPTRLLATGPGNGGGVLLNVTAGSTYGNPTNVSLIPGFGGEIRVARVDVNGDGTRDLVAGSGPGGSRIRILNGNDNTTVIADFNAFPGFAGGVYVAGGDFNGDGFEELVVTGDGADAFSGPVANGLGVRIYSGITLTGSNPPVLASFNGLASLSGAQGEGAAVRLGGRPAVADVNGDARPDLLIAAGNGGGPRVVIWPGQAFLTTSNGQPPVNPIANLFVFESTQRGGAFLTAGDLNGDNFADIAVGGGPGGGPRVRTVNSFRMLGLPNLEAVNLDDPVNLANGLVLNNFFSGDGNSRGGVRVAMRDADLDGLADLVTASGTNEPSQIRIYTDTSVAAVFGTSSEPSGPQVIDPFSALLPGGIWIG
jgi:autotransporter-associated beta strand protein